MKIKSSLLALALGSIANAQEQNQDRPPRPLPPIIVALDADKDGVISAEEITNAAKALATLDKNKDGKLTHEELRPPRPEGGPEGRPEKPEGRPERPEGKPERREPRPERPER